jgi:hypothetical protein
MPASSASRSKGIDTTGTDHAESAFRSAGVSKLTLVVTAYDLSLHTSGGDFTNVRQGNSPGQWEPIGS